jgi:hypothetical protein
LDKQIIRSCYTYRRIVNKHDIKHETITSKPIIYNKLKHRVDQVERKTHINVNRINTLAEEQVHNNMIKYINGEIDDNELNDIMFIILENRFTINVIINN